MVVVKRWCGRPAWSSPSDFPPDWERGGPRADFPLEGRQAQRPGTSGRKERAATKEAEADRAPKGRPGTGTRTTQKRRVIADWWSLVNKVAAKGAIRTKGRPRSGDVSHTSGHQPTTAPKGCVQGRQDEPESWRKLTSSHGTDGGEWTSTPVKRHETLAHFAKSSWCLSKRSPDHFAF